MKRYSFLLLLIIALTFVSSCKKKAIELNPDYIGEWRTEYDIHDGYILLTIGDDGKAHYMEYGPNADEDLYRMARIKDDVFYIGREGLDIFQGPTLVSDTTCAWSSSGGICIVYSATMHLGNWPYYRVETTYEY